MSFFLPSLSQTCMWIYWPEVLYQNNNNLGSMAFSKDYRSPKGDQKPPKIQLGPKQFRGESNPRPLDYETGTLMTVPPGRLVA